MMKYQKTILAATLLLLATAATAQLQFKTENPIDYFSSIDMNNNQIANLSDPVNGGDAVPLNYIQGRFVERNGDTMSGNLNMNGNNITAVDNLKTGGQNITVQDTKNNRDIMRLKQGGNVEIPNGNLKVSGHVVHNGGRYVTGISSGSGSEVIKIGEFRGRNFGGKLFVTRAQDHGNAAVSNQIVYIEKRGSDADAITKWIGAQSQPVEIIITNTNNDANGDGYDDSYLYAKCQDFCSTKLMMEFRASYEFTEDKKTGLTDSDIVGTVQHNSVNNYSHRVDASGNVEIPNGNLNMNGNNIALNGGYLSNDGDNEGITVDDSGNVAVPNGNLNMSFNNIDGLGNLRYWDKDGDGDKWGIWNTGDDVWLRLRYGSAGDIVRFVDNGNVQIPNGNLDVSSPSNSDHTVDVGGSMGVEGNLDMNSNDIKNIDEISEPRRAASMNSLFHESFEDNSLGNWAKTTDNNGAASGIGTGGQVGTNPIGDYLLNMEGSDQYTYQSDIDIDNIGEAVLSFYWSCRSCDGEGGYAYISTDGGSSWTQVRRLRPQGGSGDTQMHYEEVDLSAYETNNIRLRFQGSPGGGDDFAVDNINIKGRDGLSVSSSATNVNAQGTLVANGNVDMNGNGIKNTGSFQLPVGTDAY